MDFTYAIVKVYVTERNIVIKRDSNVITIWRVPAIKVTALLRKSTSKNERCVRKSIRRGCEGQIEKKRPSRSQSHYENTPIQIYWKFYRQKNVFSDKFFFFFFFFIFLLQT